MTDIFLELYSTFNRTDIHLLQNSEAKSIQKPIDERPKDIRDVESTLVIDGTKMLLEQYAKFFDVEEKFGDFKTILDELPTVTMNSFFAKQNYFHFRNLQIHKCQNFLTWL